MSHFQPRPSRVERRTPDVPAPNTSATTEGCRHYHRPKLCSGWELALVAGLTLSVTPAADQEKASEQTPLVMNWTAAEWNPPSTRPGFPVGLRNAPGATDPATGGVTYLARFPAGSRFEMH